MCVEESLMWVCIYNCNVLARRPLACSEKVKGKVILWFWCQGCTKGLNKRLSYREETICCVRVYEQVFFFV